MEPWSAAAAGVPASGVLHRAVPYRTAPYPTLPYRTVAPQALCDSFLVGIPTEEQRKNLHDCMCTALELDADQIKKDSDELKAEAAGKSEADFLAMPELKVSPTCLLY